MRFQKFTDKKPAWARQTTKDRVKMCSMPAAEAYAATASMPRRIPEDIPSGSSGAGIYSSD